MHDRLPCWRRRSSAAAYHDRTAQFRSAPRVCCGISAKPRRFFGFMPQPLILYGFGSLDDQIDLSPFVHKLEAWLRLADVPYRKQAGSIFKAPRGKLPFVEIEGRLIADSQDVIDHLQHEGIGDLDGWLTPRQRATSTALRSMIEEDLYFSILHLRWIADEAWADYAPALREVMVGFGMPRLVARIVPALARRGVAKQLKGQGAGRRPPEQLRERRCGSMH